MALGFSRSLLRALLVVSVAGAALVGTQGCIITTTDNTPAPANGNLVVNWTIQGSSDPSACTARNAAYLRFRVFNAAGQQVGGTDYEYACSAFHTSLVLAPGRGYTVQALLTDASRNPRTTTVTPPAFEIIGNFDSDVTVTFPDTSFLK